ncbi:MAG: hypothetical protein G01um101416_371 [Microgenomates group bacterium Gr01-1014_16]|nr:MAG: hypothetical protein G01um101416_371 [Microgenomates group bacterium Gr01-1014_16]
MIIENEINITNNSEEFIHTALRKPRSIIVLRGSISPSDKEIYTYLDQLGSQHPSLYGKITIIKNDPSIKNSTAMSLNALVPHTDGAFIENPPSRTILSFINSDPKGGGASIFIPLGKILADLPNWAMDALTNDYYLFPRTYDGNLSDSYTGPVLNKDPQGNFNIRWRADKFYRPKVVKNNDTRGAEAIDWLYTYIEKCKPITYDAKSGETLLVPNSAMLHGRTPLSPNSTREVLRVWIV